MAGQVSNSSYSFNDSGLLLAQWSETGKLKIWDTSTGLVKQEYTKNLHLTSPCTCLYWLQVSKRGGPKKKKLKLSGQDGEVSSEVLALGTVLGNILLYDVATNEVRQELEGHTSRVNSISWSNDKSIFSCSDDKTIIEWDLENFKIKSKWKTGNESMTCLLALSNDKELLSACYCIKLWDIEKKSVVRTFTGHGTEINSMVEIPGIESYFITSAQGDRILSAWSLNSKDKITAVASFVLKDSPLAIYIENSGSDSPSVLYAVTEFGAVQVFKHKLNGNVGKPVKPISTLSVTSESKHRHPLLVYAILPLYNGNFLMAYGSPVFLLFEKISHNEIKQENVVLVRDDKRKFAISDFNNKVKIPEVNENTEYEVPATTSLKRSKKKSDVDVPLEERLDNLALVNTLISDAHKKDNMAQLLVQGLQSGDRTVIQTVLFRTDDATINSTVKNLPVAALPPLLRELSNLLQGKTFTSKCAVSWLISVLRHHSGILLSFSEVSSIFEPMLSSVETRMSLLPSLLRLRGRLGLIREQLGTNTNEEVEVTNEPLISYQEQDSSDDGDIDVPSEGSDSDENWDEFSEMEDQDQDEEIDDK